MTQITIKHFVVNFNMQEQSKHYRFTVLDLDHISGKALSIRDN
jgi:hypothetical protein